MVSSSESQVARRYADALLAACSDDEINDLSDELNSFANAVEESSDLKNVLLNPTFSAEEQQATLAAIMAHFSMSERSQNFINLLVERDRQGELKAISDAFRGLVDKKMNRAAGIIRTAAELDEATQEQLKRALEKRTGKQLDLEVVIDPSLIGGVRAEVGTLVFDGTIKSELEKLRETLRPV